MYKTVGNISKRHGFTFIELIVVVLLLGIIAAVAAPRMFNATTSARENAARAKLEIIRNAIELYYSQYNEYPGQSPPNQSTFKSDLSQYLRGPFPTCDVGNNNNDVRIQQTGNPLSPSGNRGWSYDNSTGEFIINDSGYSSW